MHMSVYVYIKKLCSLQLSKNYTNKVNILAEFVTSFYSWLRNCKTHLQFTICDLQLKKAFLWNSIYKKNDK